jgi:hypothetical protein
MLDAIKATNAAHSRVRHCAAGTPSQRQENDVQPAKLTINLLEAVEIIPDAQRPGRSAGT